jgi:hypothetical protein
MGSIWNQAFFKWFAFFISILMIFLYVFSETVQSPPQKVRSKTLTTQIPISVDSAGCPALPTTTMADGYKASTVQSMFRQYCTAHIREKTFHPFAEISDMYQRGCVTGRQAQVIPWGTLAKNPASWISAECFPDDFKWNDPSHIKVGEIYRLLDYWRDRQDKGMDPLIWLPTSPVFEGMEDDSKLGRTIRRARVPLTQDSDEEVFVLPSSRDSDQKGDESDDNGSSGKSSSVRYSSDNAESIDLDVGSLPMLISHPLESGSGEPHIYLFDFECITYASCSGDGGWWEICSFRIHTCKC